MTSATEQAAASSFTASMLAIETGWPFQASGQVSIWM